MIKLLQLIFLGHVHKWELLRSNRLNLYGKSKLEETGDRFLFKCSVCNAVKKKDVY